VVRSRNGTWWVAAIEPAGNPASATKPPQTSRRKTVLALPKGLVDPGEKAAETALREVFEETGIIADVVRKLADIKYVYTRTWGDKQRVFKIVSFFLMKYRSGRINEIAPEMRVEVARARWVPLGESPTLLAYTGERQMVQRALEYVGAHPELQG
jgi:8-oxo-dGTP pyrophosphatase MutT (NUDIX family)